MKNIVFSVDGIESREYTYLKHQTWPYFTPYLRNICKWIAELNVKGEARNLEESLGEHLHDLGVGQIFLKHDTKCLARGEESRWWRNRTGWSLSLLQIHWKNNRMVNKVYKTTSLITSSGHQAPRKAAHCLRREVGQGYWRLKRETRERGTETHPGKGVLLEEVSNHQETLVLAGLGEVFKSQRAT